MISGIYNSHVETKHPLQQGLRRNNGHRNGLCGTVETKHPLQQGLRPCKDNLCI